MGRQKLERRIDLADCIVLFITFEINKIFLVFVPITRIIHDYDVGINGDYTQLNTGFVILKLELSCLNASDS